MRNAGVHNFPAIDRVIYGKAASQSIRAEAERLDARRVFLIASRTLNSNTDEIEKIRHSVRRNRYRRSAANGRVAAAPRSWGLSSGSARSLVQTGSTRKTRA